MSFCQVGKSKQTKKNLANIFLSVQYKTNPLPLHCFALTRLLVFPWPVGNSKRICKSFRKRDISLHCTGPPNFQLNWKHVLNATLMLSKLTPLCYERKERSSSFSVVAHDPRFMRSPPPESSQPEVVARNRKEKSQTIFIYLFIFLKKSKSNCQAQWWIISPWLAPQLPLP